MRCFKPLLTALVVGLSGASARADIKPHPIFSDNMVLQQGVDFVVWGKADPGERIDASLEFRQGNAGGSVGMGITADKDGNWSVNFGKRQAGSGYTIRLKGKNAVELKNVAVGEVWVCSGQSNMEWSINAGETPDKVKEAAKNPDLRLFTVKKHASDHPISNPEELTYFTKWVESSPDSVGNFSAVAYHFGQKLQHELGVPVGLIHTSWGGTPAEAWTSVEALSAVPSLKYYADAANRSGKKVGPFTPGALYNAMIFPLLKFKVKGAIWYQGESNTGKAYEYRTLLPTMIEDWRKRFDCELPFMVVQLAPFGNGKNNSNGVTYAELRDAQLYTSKKSPKVGLAVITDVGNETDIHPKPKQPVGERLALAALGIAYEKKIEYSGPHFKNAKFETGSAIVSFDHLGGGLVAKDGDLTGFTVAGKDGIFHPAKATIRGDTVVATSEQVPEPIAVRYGWVNFANPTLNLFNKAGLPASPFRSDDFPLTTMPKPRAKDQ
ncbi:MAG TPA: sialate O-acetylesterase [Gemmata sp.]|nr:sialate O-acetylesterase [Gemmata sp.]